MTSSDSAFSKMPVAKSDHVLSAPQKPMTSSGQAPTVSKTPVATLIQAPSAMKLPDHTTLVPKMFDKGTAVEKKTVKSSEEGFAAPKTSMSHTQAPAAMKEPHSEGLKSSKISSDGFKASKVLTVASGEAIEKQLSSAGEALKTSKETTSPAEDLTTLKDPLTLFSKTVNSTEETAGEAIKEHLSSAGEVLKSSGEGLLSSAGEALEALKRPAEAIKEQVTSSASEALKASEDILSSAGKALKALKSPAEVIKEKVALSANEALKASEDILSSAGEALKPSKEPAEAGQAIKEQLESAGEALKTSTDSLLTGKPLKTSTPEALMTSKEPLTLFSKTVNTTEETSTAGEAIKEHLSSAGESLKSTGEGLL